jgi:hypothetical protein
MEDSTMNEVFEKVEEEERLYQELTRGSKAYDFILSVDDFQQHIIYCLDQMRNIVQTLRRTEHTTGLATVLTKFRFFLFSLGAVHLSLENLLFQETERLGLKERLHPIVEDWKKSVPVQLLKAYRNRTQHSRYPLPVLNIEATGPSHPRGVTWSAEFRLSDGELAAITIDLNADLRARCEAFLTEKVKDKPDGLFTLLFAYKAALDDLVVRMRATLRGTHSAEFENLRTLVQRIDAVRAWLIAHHVENPQQRTADDLLLPVRDW